MSEKMQQLKRFFAVWMRPRLWFSLLRSIPLCLRGNRSSGLIALYGMGYELAEAESRIRMRSNYLRMILCAYYSINSATTIIACSGSGGSNSSKTRDQQRNNGCHQVSLPSKLLGCTFYMTHQIRETIGLLYI